MAGCSAPHQQPAGVSQDLHQLNVTVQKPESFVGTLLARLEKQESQLTAVSKASHQETQIDELAHRLKIIEKERKNPPQDCSDIPASAHSGVYLLWPGHDCSQPLVSAFCDGQCQGNVNHIANL